MSIVQRPVKRPQIYRPGRSPFSTEPYDHLPPTHTLQCSKFEWILVYTLNENGVFIPSEDRWSHPAPSPVETVYLMSCDNYCLLGSLSMEKMMFVKQRKNYTCATVLTNFMAEHQTNAASYHTPNQAGKQRWDSTGSLASHRGHLDSVTAPKNSVGFYGVKLWSLELFNARSFITIPNPSLGILFFIVCFPPFLTINPLVLCCHSHSTPHSRTIILVSTQDQDPPAISFPFLPSFHLSPWELSKLPSQCMLITCFQCGHLNVGPAYVVFFFKSTAGYEMYNIM